MDNENIISITDVRIMLKDVAGYLSTFNTHIIDNSVDTYDYDNIKMAWLILRELQTTRWTNDYF